MKAGDQLLHYRLESEVGRGGMGVVWRATDENLRRPVALKFLADEVVRDRDRLRRLTQEARSLAALSHPNVATVFGLLEDPDTRLRFIAMEYVEGSTLAELIAEGPLGMERTAAIGREIASAIEYAHECGVIHRDLKPSNVVIRRDGVVKVLDFGLARSASNGADDLQSTTTQPGIVLGTAAYASPEQARGLETDRRTDVWSFGCMLFEMVEGRPLFRGDTVSDTIAAVLKDPLPWDQGGRHPEPIGWLIRRCVERDPKVRLRDIGEARIALERMDTYLPTLNTGATTKSRRFELLLPGLEVGMLREPAISPDGRSVVFATAEGLAVRAVDALDHRPLPGTRGAIIPFWSPDSTEVAFVSDGRLWRVSASAGTPKPVCTLPDGAAGGAGGCWSTRGDIFFSMGSVGGIRRVNASGGRAEVYCAPDERGDVHDFHDPELLPDEKTMVTVLHREAAIDELAVVTSEGAVSISEPDDVTKCYPVFDESGLLLYESHADHAGIWAQRFSVARRALEGEPVLVVPDARYFSLSKTGTLLYVPQRHAGRRRIVRLDRNGALKHEVGDPIWGGGRPRLSPDGQWVAVRQGSGPERDLWLLSTQDSRRTPLGLDRMPHEVDWSPDGRSLLLSVQGAGRKEVHHRPLDAAAPDWRLAGRCAAFSSNGREIVHLDERCESLSVATPQGEERVIQQGRFRDIQPSPSPDGRFVVYQSADQEVDQIFIASMEDPDRRWQVSKSGGAFPRWSHDGSEVFYETANTMYAVRVSTEPIVSIGAPEALFSVNALDVDLALGFDVTPEGDFIAVQFDEVIEGPKRLTVIENWRSA